ncbi:glycosyltransferase, partial [Candidatus Bathyarchaeota archaeon]|nr:glycosyltransferase [Candidatus Bathyarchaeota archaeon]
MLREMRNIEVYINPPRASLIELMQHSSIMLSTQPDEAFGMAVVEAVSMGCIPVVYRDGGPWTDILEENDGVYGYAYENAVEATERIEEILGDGELRARLRENSIQRSKEFDSAKFVLKILKII